MRAESDCVIARNRRDYQKVQIPVYTPGEFLEKLKLLSED